MKKNNNNANKPSLFQNLAADKGFRYGGFSVVLILIVLAILIGVNLIVAKLPTNLTKLDATTAGVFSISETTEQFLQTLEEDVTIYLVAETGKENNTLLELLKKYEDASPHIQVVKKDPVLYPAFTANYTDAEVAGNSLIVESTQASRVIGYDEIFVADTSLYYYTGSYTYTFAGESKITNAIEYVVSDSLPKVYLLFGHDESALSSSMQSYIEDENITVESLSLVETADVPDDCNVLLLNCPQKDISEGEKTAILSYLERGGSLLLFTSYLEEEMPNLMNVMEYYGAQPQNGIAMDPDTAHFYSVYYNLLPNKQSHTITTPLIDNSQYILLSVAHGIAIEEQYRSSMTVTPLLTTSDAAYVKVDGYNLETYDKEAGDIDGPLNLGVAIEETYDTIQTRIVWFSTGSLLDDTIDTVVAGGNSSLVLNAIGWLSGEQASALSIAPRDLTQTHVTMSSAQSLTWIVVMLGVIPLGILAFGLVYWLRRRKR